MDCEYITTIEDCSCLQCGAEISRGEEVVQDKLQGTVFCTELHWAAYYDVDDAREEYEAEMAGGDPIDE